MTTADVVDRLLEATIAPSFTRVGEIVRRRTDHWSVLDGYDLSGRVVVVTGATSGIGFAAATQLVRCGANVEIIARDEAKTAKVVAELRDLGGRSTVYSSIADMSDLGQVRSAATAILDRHHTIDVLMHNAGALDANYEITTDGLERTVASQVIGPFLLTGLLLPGLRAAALSRPSRILFVASGGMYSEPLSVAALDAGAELYNGTTVYARAKRAQVTLAEMWGARLASDGVIVHSMHPGWADTPGVQRALPTFRRVVGPLLRSADEGADTLVWLAADDGAPLTSTGGFWHDRRRRATHRLARTRKADTAMERARLWAWCEQHSGWNYEAEAQ